MAKAFIIHGWEGTPENNWFPWVKSNLEAKGYSVEVPEMPETETPKIDAWLQKLNEIASDASEEDIFIAHSIGCQAVVRFLETSGKKVKKVFLVAPWVTLKEEAYEDDESREIAKPWIEKPIDWEKAKDCSEYVCIFSSNDPYVSFDENSEVFKQKLNAQIISIPDREHFTEKEEQKLWEEISKNL